MSNITLTSAMQSLNMGQRWDMVTGVRLKAGRTEDGEALEYFVGTEGTVLDVSVPGGTFMMAATILDGLRKRGYRYQPFESGDAVTDPAAEIGDSVSVAGSYSTVMGIEQTHSRLMASTLKAPYDEEVDHEFQFETRSARAYGREVRYTRSRLTINENAITAEVTRATAAEGVLGSRITLTAESITAEVTRATDAEGALSSRITLTAESITAEVTRATAAEGSLSTLISQNATAIEARVTKTGGAASSFGWTLTDSSWLLSANSQEVFKVTSSGLSVKGAITATSLTLASGVMIPYSSVSGTPDLSVYIAQDGTIGSTPAAGATGFNVSSAGLLTCSNAVVYGTIYATAGTIGGWTIASSMLEKGGGNDELYRVRISSLMGGENYNAIVVAARETTSDSFDTKFSVTYGGKLYAKNAEITGQITATSLTLASGVTIPYSSVSGTPDLSVYIAKDGTIGSTPAPGATGFKVSSAGLLTCSNAVVYGTIYATAGTIGGWTIASSMLEKGGGDSELYRVRISSLMGGENYNAIVVAARETTSDSFDTKFSVTYGGKLYAKNADIEGKITATSGQIGDLTVQTVNNQPVIRGITGPNINAGTITGGSGGNIAGTTITTGNVVSGINTSLNNADFANGVFNNTNTADFVRTTFILIGPRYTQCNLQEFSFIDGNGITRTFQAIMPVSGT